MHAKTVKRQCTFPRSHAINKLFHIRWYIGWFIGRYRATYRPIFQISAVFCCKRYGKRFLYIVSAANKKGDIRQYLDRLGQYLKQGISEMKISDISPRITHLSSFYKHIWGDSTKCKYPLGVYDPELTLSSFIWFM